MKLMECLLLVDHQGLNGSFNRINGSTTEVVIRHRAIWPSDQPDQPDQRELFRSRVKENSLSKFDHMPRTSITRNSFTSP